MIIVQLYLIYLCIIYQEKETNFEQIPNSTDTDTSNKTKEEDCLESLIRVLLNFAGDAKIEITVDLEILQSYNIYLALMDKIEEINDLSNV